MAYGSQKSVSAYTSRNETELVQGLGISTQEEPRNEKGALFGVKGFTRAPQNPPKKGIRAYSGS